MATRTTTQARTTKAFEAHSVRKAEVLESLENIKQAVKAHGIMEDKDWSMVGTLAHVRDELQNIEGFLGLLEDGWDAC